MHFRLLLISQGCKVNVVRVNKQLLDSTCSTGHTSELPASSNLGSSRMLSFMHLWWKSMKKLFQWQRMQKDCRSDCMASHVSWWEQPRRRGHCGWALELASKTIRLSHWGSPKHCPQCLIKTFQGFFSL